MKRSAVDVLLVGVLLVLLYILYTGGVDGLLKALAKFLGDLQAKMNDLLNKVLASKPFAGREFGFPNPAPGAQSGAGAAEKPITGDAGVYTGTDIGLGIEESQLWGI